MDQTVYERDRCHAQTKAGTRCKRNTIKYARFCWMHAKSEQGVKIDDSTIPNAGHGLFATRTLPANTKIQYGRPQDIVPGNTINQRYGANGLGQYVACNHAGTLCADARSTQSGLGRWIDDPRNANRNNTRISVGIMQGRPYANAVLTKQVPAGRELFAPYGRKFWRTYNRLHNQG
jgi:hypothetical protein